MALLKFYRGAVAPTSPVQGMIWFNNVTETVEGVEQVKNLIKVYTGTEWEVYGTTDADLKALAARVATLEGDVKTINETTLPALKAELEKYADDAVAAEAEIARAAEEALGKRIDAVVAASVSVAEKADGHVTVSKATDEVTGAVVYTVAENDIASAQALTDEIKRATDEEARIEGLVTAEVAARKQADLDLKAELLGDAAEEYNTLGKLEDKIQAVEAAAVSVKEGTINHVKVTKSGTEYTVEGVDIASAEALAKEITDARAAEKGLADRLGVIEGEGEGSIKKAVADVKAELVGDAETLKTFGAVEDAIAEVEAAAKAAATLLTVDSEGHVTVSGKQDETTGAWTYTIGENDIASKAVVDTLVGEDKDMSARAIVQDEVAKQLTSENISDSFDTLKEMAEWLSSHPEDVQEMNDAIGANKTAIEAEVLRATTAESNLQTAIDNEVSAREAAIAALDAEVTSTDGAKVTVKVTEVDGKITAVNVTESDIASAAALATLDAEVQEHEVVVSAALNDLNARMTTADGSVADHEARLTQAEADIDALEAWKEGLNTGVMSVTGDESNAYVKVAANPTSGDVALGVTVTSVDAANGGAAGLATDAYVREQIAAAAMVWEEGSF